MVKMVKQMGKTKVHIKARTLNLDAMKVELETTMVSCISNAI
jgi:hypothetical protein